MRESIVCIGQIGTKSYRFPETGIQISSYEELCYYLSRHMVCYLYTLPEEELLLEADRWATRHGGESGRVAQQFVDMLAGKNNSERA